MDHWNLFNTSSHEPAMLDYNRSINSNPPALNRYNSMNGHSGSTNTGMNTPMNTSNMNPYNSSMGSINSSMGSINSSMNGSNPSMNHHNTMNPLSQVNNMGPYGNSSINSYNASVSNNGTSMNAYPRANPSSNGGGMNAPYNLNTSMPPPSSSSQGNNMQAPNSYGHQPQPQQQQQQRNSYNNYYDQPSAVNPPGPPRSNSSAPSNFPPPPSASNSAYYSNNSSNNMYNNSTASNSSSHYPPPHHSIAANRTMPPPPPPSTVPPMPPQQQQQSTTNYYSDNSTSATGGSSFPPIGEFKIGTFTLGANGVPTENNGPESNNRSYSGSNTNGSTSSDANQNVRETGIIEKLLQTYGFIQCCERQARLFFHFSQFDGNTDHLRIGDPVEFEVTFDRRTGKPIASTVQKISPEVVLSEERVVGAVTTELHDESSGEAQGRISYENRGECFFLPYGKDDVEGYVVLKPGDKVSFQIATNQRTGNLAARHVRLENPVAPVRYQGVVSSIKDDSGYIERADVVDEILFELKQTKHIPGGLKLGDDVDFCITMRKCPDTLQSKEIAIEIVKLQDGSVVFEDTSQDLVRGQVLKTVERSPRHNSKDPLPGRIRYRGKDRSEVEVKFGERDQRGDFTLRHGDWVEFNIATDRRDRLQKATNITLLDESFSVSGERREHGVVHLLQEEFGYMLCCDRDMLLHFYYRELLDPSTAVSIGDELAFTVVQDSNLNGPNKYTATRVAHLAKGTIVFNVVVQENLQGQVVSLPEKPAPLVAPALPGSLVPPKEELGTITYLVEGQRHSLEYAYDDSIAFLNVGDKVMFSVHFSKRRKQLIATKLSFLSLAAVTNSSADTSAAASNSLTSSLNMLGISSSNNCPTDSGVAAINVSQQFAADAVRDPTTTTNVVLHEPTTLAALSTSSSKASENTSTNNAAVTNSTVAVLNGYASSTTSNGVISDSNTDEDDAGTVHSTAGSNKNACAAPPKKVASNTQKSGSPPKLPRQMFQGYVAALKESFGFVETANHDKEIFFHFSNVENGESSKLELGDEVEYRLSSRTGPGGKVSAENIQLLPKGTLATPKVLEPVYNGLVIRPIRSSNPDQIEYCGLLAVDTDDIERSEQYKFGITGVVNKRELLQKSDTVTFQVDETGWATNIAAVRKKLIATVDTVKGQYGFLNYEAEEGKKLFFHQTEVKDKASLSPGDEVEFVIITNQKTGKSSACSIARIMPVGGQSRRPQRLMSQLKSRCLDQSKPRIIVMRQPRGPDGTKGFSLTRDQLANLALA